MDSASPLLKTINIVVCVMFVLAFIHPAPLSAEEDDFAQYRRDMRVFRDKSELAYHQFMAAYEDLRDSAIELDEAYSSGDAAAIEEALSRYDAARLEFQRASSQALALIEEGKMLGARTVAYAETSALPESAKEDIRRRYEEIVGRADLLAQHLTSLSASLAIGNQTDLTRLKGEMASFEDFVDTSLVYAATLQPLREKQEIELSEHMVRPVEGLRLKGREIVNPDVNKTLSEAERAVEKAKAELDAVEAMYGDLLAVEDYIKELDAIEAELRAEREAISRKITPGDIDDIIATEEALARLLVEIDDIISGNVAIAAASIYELTALKFQLQDLYKLVHHINELSPEHNPRALALEQEITAILDRIEIDFKYTWYTWYLLGEDMGVAGGLKEVGNELRGIEKNLEKAAKGKKANPYQGLIDDTKALREDVSGLRNYALRERGELKSLSTTLRLVGLGWVKVYRDLIELVQPVAAVPVPEYLNETVDARITPEVRALAAALGDPTSMYGFVRDNVSFQAYLGSARGSAWTLSSMAGNDYDQASLLIALLRAAGYPARYVHGWIELSADQLISILGGLNVTVNETSFAMSFDQAVEVIDAVGIPHVRKNASIEMEHVWVEVALPSASGYNVTTWSFEELEFEDVNRTLIGDGVAIPAIRSVKLVVPGYVWQALDPSFMGYNVLRSINYAEVPDDMRHRVHIKTSDDIDSGLIPLPLLAGERIVLKYEPTSGSIADPLGDESLFRLLDEGGRDWYVGYYTWGYWLTGPTWAYAYPRLLIDNETVSVGSSSKLGEWRELYFNFSIAGEFMLETKWIHVGNMYSLVLSPGREFPDRITEEASRVTELYQGYNASGSASDYDSFVAQMLHATGMAFFAAYDKTRGLGKEVFLAENYPVTVRNDYVARDSEYWEDWYLSWGAGNVYARYRPAGVAHDFPVHITKTYSRIGQSEGRVAFRLLPAGFAGSGWESQSIYALYNVTGVSTTYILAWAQNHSIPVYTINQSNYAELVPKLRVDQWLRDRVTRAAQSGRVVIIPDRYLRIEKWYGTGWTELDPTTGAGGYLIVGVMTYMNTGEAGNASIELGPEHVSVGGHAAQPLNLEWGQVDFSDVANYLENMLGEGFSGWGSYDLPPLLFLNSNMQAGFSFGKRRLVVFKHPFVGINSIGTVVSGIFIFLTFYVEPVNQFDIPLPKPVPIDWKDNPDPASIYDNPEIGRIDLTKGGWYHIIEESGHIEITEEILAKADTEKRKERVEIWKDPVKHWFMIVWKGDDANLYVVFINPDLKISTAYMAAKKVWQPILPTLPEQWAYVLSQIQSIFQQHVYGDIQDPLKPYKIVGGVAVPL